MSVIRKPGPYVLWIALATTFIMTACDQHAGAPTAGKHAPMPLAISPIDVTRIDLGASVNPDGTVSNPVATFKPADTIYAAVTTVRPGHGIALKAKWMFQDGTTFKEITKTINPTDTLVTDFQVSNGDGWPVGQYKVTILVNDRPDGSNHAVALTVFDVKP